MQRRVVRRSQSTFDAPDGTRLLRRSWLPPQPRRVLLLVHGFAEHSNRYDHVGAWFAARDSAVQAYDQRGHGRSDGRRCHVRSFDELLDDLEAVLASVRLEHAEQPITLVGHSMGGLVVATLLSERKPDVQAAVTSGAALELGPGVSRGRLGVIRALRRIAPRLTLSGGIDPEGLSRDPGVVRSYVEDPLVGRRLSASLASELLACVERTSRAATQVQVPMLLLHGEADSLCPPRASRAFHGQLLGPGHRLRLYPKLRHEIFNEPEQEQVFEDILQWLEERGA